MQTPLIIVIPVVVVLLIIGILKLKPLFSYMAIFGLGVLSSFVVEFFFCSGLQTQCEADALNMVGFFFHSFYVIAICSVFNASASHCVCRFLRNYASRFKTKIAVNVLTK